MLLETEHLSSSGVEELQKPKQDHARHGVAAVGVAAAVVVVDDPAVVLGAVVAPTRTQIGGSLDNKQLLYRPPVQLTPPKEPNRLPVVQLRARPRPEANIHPRPDLLAMGVYNACARLDGVYSGVARLQELPDEDKACEVGRQFGAAPARTVRMLTAVLHPVDASF